MSRRWDDALALAQSAFAEGRTRVASRRAVLRGVERLQVEGDIFLGPEGACGKCDHLFGDHVRLNACTRCLCNRYEP